MVIVLGGCAGTPLTVPAQTVKMTSAGFEPASPQIVLNQEVCWKNDDAQDRWPASNIHPSHEIYPEFDPGDHIKPGDTWCFTFYQEGIWQFHDHLLPEFGGVVVVGSHKIHVQ